MHARARRCAFLTLDRLLSTALLLVRSVLHGTFYSPAAVARDAHRHRAHRSTREEGRLLLLGAAGAAEAAELARQRR